jgi:DNA polymerase-3 subunit delta
MIYLLYGIENNLIEDYINNIIKEKDIKNVIKYDLEITSIENIIEDAGYDDMFGENKLIIVYNSEFLSNKNSEGYEIVEKYLSNPNLNNHLIFILNKDKINDKNNIVSVIKDKYTVVEFNKLKGFNLEKYVKSEFENENYKIDDDSIKNIISILNGDLNLIKNEIIKLKLYKFGEKEITLKDVKSVISKLPEDDVFELVNAVVNKDKKATFNIYKDLINRKEDDIKILGALSNQIRLLFQVKTLVENGNKKDEIATLLNIHPYRIQLAIASSSKFTKSSLLNLLEILSDIDLNIKSGKMDKTKALEMFFLAL